MRSFTAAMRQTCTTTVRRSAGKVRDAALGLRLPAKQILLICTLFLICTLGFFIKNKTNGNLNHTRSVSIKRNMPGKGKKQDTLDAVIDGVTYSVPIQISERAYNRQELDQAFDTAYSQLLSGITEGQRPEYVTSDLHLPTELDGLPFSINWQSDKPETVDPSGHLHRLNIPAGGTFVTLQAQLTYMKESRSYSFPIRVYADTVSDKDYEALLQETLSAADQTGSDTDYVRLPDTIASRKIIWKRPTDYTFLYLLLLSLICTFLYPSVQKNRTKKEKLKRQSMIRAGYAPFIGRLLLYMNCGLSLRNALEKAAGSSSYIPSSSSPLYEELYFFINELNSGYPLHTSLERFQERVDLPEYRRLCSLLIQNHKKGTKGLSCSLKAEAETAFRERKNRAKKQGEEAGTKLLLPMLLMFAVVLIIMITPAFLSLRF